MLYQPKARPSGKGGEHTKSFPLKQSSHLGGFDCISIEIVLTYAPDPIRGPSKVAVMTSPPAAYSSVGIQTGSLKFQLSGPRGSIFFFNQQLHLLPYKMELTSCVHLDGSSDWRASHSPGTHVVRKHVDVPCFVGKAVHRKVVLAKKRGSFSKHCTVVML